MCIFLCESLHCGLNVQMLFVFCCLDAQELWSEADSSCSGQPIHLWQFLRELLLKPHNYGRCIRWLNKEKGIFIFLMLQQSFVSPNSFKLL